MIKVLFICHGNICRSTMAESVLKNDPEEKLYKFLTFAGSGRDIADPWYTGNFDETYEDIQEGCEGFLDYLEKHGEIHY